MKLGVIERLAQMLKEIPLLADVLVEVPGWGVDRVFQYGVPDHLAPILQVGHRVQVSFGKRRVTGFVVGFSHQILVPDIKNIDCLVDEGLYFGQRQLQLAKWMADYYFSPMVKALQTVIAPKLKKTAPRQLSRYYCNVGDAASWDILRQQMEHRAPKSWAVLKATRHQPGLYRSELAAAADASTGVIDRLVTRGLISVETKIVPRDPFADEPRLKETRFNLTLEQQKALSQIKQGLMAGEPQVYVLHGVTGSGKTEVYLRSIEETLRLGRQTVTLVPEISLTPQMITAYRSRFGHEVAVLHSRMSDGERYDMWQRIEKRDARVILGARSAVLAPVQDLGLMILDEEHEWSYKQDETPRYHARAVALYRSRQYHSVLVLGSATPSLETYSRALPGGIYNLLPMKHRINRRAMPQVQIVDMRQEVQAGNAGIFARPLVQKLREVILNQEQAIIFLNRRGLNTLVVCRECGLVLKCPRCAISLTYHRDGRLRCHYCRYTTGIFKICPDCSSKQVGFFGTGTQRVEQELQSLLPEAQILRMDADTTTRKGSHRQILDDFANRKAHILVGTQMIAKGLDLPGVTLVGVINADLTLHMPDFRAGERTFQLLAQVAGRAGRGQKSGQVLIQTYTPAHYAVQAAAKHDYDLFYQQELAMRKKMGYPPFSKMARILITGKDEAKVQQSAESIKAVLDQLLPGQSPIQMVGPAPSPLSRLREVFRWHIIIWSKDYNLLHQLLEKYWQNNRLATPSKGVRVNIDIDPMSMM